MSERAPWTLLAGLCLFLGLLAAGNVLAERHRAAWDLTAERSASLSEETLRVLEEVDRPVVVTAFFGREEVGRVEAATLLSRYRRANRNLRWRILDPRLHPGEAQRGGAVAPGAALVEDVPTGRLEVAPFTIEIDVTSAIARLIRDDPGTVCFTTGHGERPVDTSAPEGLGRAARILQANGYTLRTVDLLVRPEPPDGCDVLVVASPTARLGEDAVRAVRAYLRGGGKAMVLADPAAGVDLTPLTRDWGISFVQGVIIEGDRDSRVRDDPSAPIVRRYAAVSPVVRGLGPTVFPGALAVVVTPPRDRPGLDVREIASTSRAAFLSATEEPVEAPLALGAAADDSEVADAAGDPEIRRTRILAWGDVDHASDAFIGEASNARLFLQGVDWLAQPEPLVGAVPNFPVLRELELTEARSDYLLFLTAVVVPGLFLLAGGFVWVVRRSL